MRLRLNGWRRLWVMVAALWALVVVAGAMLSAPTARGVPSEDVLIDRLPPEHRALLKGFIPDSGLEVEFPNGHVLKFRMNVTEEQMLPVTKAYAAVIDRALSENRRTFWTKALLIWLLPLLLIYAIGEGVAWVRRGFRSPVA